MSRFLSTLFRTCLQVPRAQTSVSAGRRLHLSAAKHGSVGEGFHKPSNIDKRILVWTKMYPNMAGVPEEVTNAKMKKAKDMFRIRVNIIMALTTIFLCVVYIRSGKEALERGESVVQQNRDRHFEFQQKK